MSSSGGHQQSQSRAIPTRTVPISDSSQLPHDYCTTPGGTLFSTTPGGTRIIYDRKFLLDRRNSPMAQTPPCHLPNIPGVTSPGSVTEDSKVEVNNLNNHDGKPIIGKNLCIIAEAKYSVSIRAKYLLAIDGIDPSLCHR
uniref:Eukaryotic translation initiation factor 4E binding protein 2 n=1 Tax=Pseudonaja textilis TaxID=8673 RepID=A0A670ZQP3_PSETE